MKGRQEEDTNFLLMSSRGLCSKDSCFVSQSDFVQSWSNDPVKKVAVVHICVNAESPLTPLISYL